jgi:hypothetical protein
MYIGLSGLYVKMCSTWYEELMCCQPVGSAIKPPTPDNWEAVNNIKERLDVPSNQRLLCVRPNGHRGSCSSTLNHLFKESNPIISKLESSIRLAIYSTPGNDDYVFKNRASRIFEIALTNDQEKMIRDKKEKKKCAIPVKDRSTPHLLAQAYLDWFVFVMNRQPSTCIMRISRCS